MKYVGSKRRIRKNIIPIILNNCDSDTVYTEPFVGGANMIQAVPSSFLRVGADANKGLISMWNALKLGWTPPSHVSEEVYQEIKSNQEAYPDYLVAYVGFNSYGGKWFGGYPRDSMGKRDYWKEYEKNIKKQLPFVMDVSFVFSDYNDLYVPKGSIVYCDPPYRDTLGYSLDGFNHDCFWDWARYQSSRSKVYISEKVAPEDFECVWEQEILSSVAHHKDRKPLTEKLFRG